MYLPTRVCSIYRTYNMTIILYQLQRTLCFTVSMLILKTSLRGQEKNSPRKGTFSLNKKKLNISRQMGVLQPDQSVLYITTCYFP